MKLISVLCNNIRSLHNVGSIFRTADAMGVDEIILVGISPRPFSKDDRLPHIARKSDEAINKTALGAQNSVHWKYFEKFEDAVNYVRNKDYTVVAIEQDDRSIPLATFKSEQNTCIVLGREVEGILKDELNLCDTIVEIPMLGQKESINVSNAGAIAMYHLRFLC